MPKCGESNKEKPIRAVTSLCCMLKMTIKSLRQNLIGGFSVSASRKDASLLTQEKCFREGAKIGPCIVEWGESILFTSVENHIVTGFFFFFFLLFPVLGNCPL